MKVLRLLHILRLHLLPKITIMGLLLGRIISASPLSRPSELTSELAVHLMTNLTGIPHLLCKKQQTM
jgi:hypothetical protein